MKYSNDIIAKVIAPYLGQRLSAELIYKGFTCELVINNFTTSMANGMTIGTAIQNNAKLILKPLSSITDEDAIEVGKIIFGEEYSVGEVNRNNDYEVSVKVLKPNTTVNQNVRICFDGNFSNCNGYGLRNVLRAIQYLISKGYDLPNHLLDGKTLFESRLAIYEN